MSEGSILLSKTSTGGEIARGGFDYQDDYVWLQLPGWLANGAFTKLISESIGDVEVCYCTMAGERRHFIEAKNYQLSPAAVWEEVEQFKRAHEHGEGIYERFVLLAPSFPPTLGPLLNNLERLRVRGEPHGRQSKIYADGHKEIVAWLEKQQSDHAHLADFVIEYVHFEEFNSQSAEQRIQGALLEAIPCFGDLSGALLKSIASQLQQIVHRTTREPVARFEVEQCLLTALGQNAPLWREYPSKLHIVRSDKECCTAVPRPMLQLDIRRFMSEQRATIGFSEWETLLGAVYSLSASVQQSRPRKRVEMTSEVRVSMAIALGHAFAATRGYILQVSHREALLCSDVVATKDAYCFQAEELNSTVRQDQGVISLHIGIPTRQDVLRACADLSLTEFPMLCLESNLPIEEAQQLCEAVELAKREIALFRSKYGLRRLHLFLKGPSSFAMSLGHRLNGIGEIQLYDWVGATYIPTALLRT